MSKHKNHLFLKDFIYLFLKREERREKERERNINVQEKHQLAASLECSQPGTWPILTVN